MRTNKLLVLILVSLFVFGGVKNTFAKIPDCGWLNRQCVNKDDYPGQKNKIAPPKNLDCVRKANDCEIVATADPTAKPTVRPTGSIYPTSTPAPTSTPIPTATKVPTPTKEPSVTPTPKVVVLGDANGDKIVDMVDFQLWRWAYLSKDYSAKADFNGDKKNDLPDYQIWKTAYLSTIN